MFTEKLKEINLKFLKNQNGLVVQTMEKRGVRYKMNYGLSMIHIKNIASDYSIDQNLADFLFQQEIRETKMLAFLLADPEKFTFEKTKEWLCRFSNSEEVEQGCNLLFKRIDFSADEVLKFCQSSQLWEKMTGYWLVARLSIRGLRFDEIEKQTFLVLLSSDCFTNNGSLRLAISRALVSFGKTDKDALAKVNEFCKDLSKSENAGAIWIAEEVSMMLEL